MCPQGGPHPGLTTALKDPQTQVGLFPAPGSWAGQENTARGAEGPSQAQASSGPVSCPFVTGTRNKSRACRRRGDSLGQRPVSLTVPAEAPDAHDAPTNEQSRPAAPLRSLSPTADAGGSTAHASPGRQARQPREALLVSHLCLGGSVTRQA